MFGGKMEDEDEEEDTSPLPFKKQRVADRAGKQRHILGGGISFTQEEIDTKVKERISVHMKDFDEDSMTGVDVRDVENLSSLEVMAEIWRNAILRDPGRFTAGEAKSISETVTKLMAESRQQASALGMDRRNRISQGESELETYLPQLHKETKKILYQNAILILCPHCLATLPRVEIRQGLLFDAPFLVYHFAWESEGWSFNAPCPKCKKDFVIDSGNYRDFLMSKIDSYQGEESGETEEENKDI